MTEDSRGIADDIFGVGLFLMHIYSAMTLCHGSGRIFAILLGARYRLGAVYDALHNYRLAAHVSFRLGFGPAVRSR